MNAEYQALQGFFTSHHHCAIAFSGGTDSTFLLYVARSVGANIHAYYVQSAFQPSWELNDVIHFAEILNTPLSVLSADVLACEEIAKNNSQRCYFCKRTLFSIVRDRAHDDGFPLLLDGTNASDDMNDRPGMLALGELSVISPLRMFGLTKAIIYSLSRQFMLPSAGKPAYACLATRVPYGQTIDRELLERIEKAENLLFEHGFFDFRVRVRDQDAILQLRQEDFSLFDQKRRVMMPSLQMWFDAIFVDAKERKGLLDEQA